MKKVFLTCDETYPLFHPAGPVKRMLADILGEDYEITRISEHFESLEAEEYQEFDLVVFYNDHWIDKSPTVYQQIPALLTYAAEGGAVLVLHNPDMGVDPETAQLLGAAPMYPLQKPESGRYTFTPAVSKLTEGVEPFVLEEERLDLIYSNLAGVFPLLYLENASGRVLCGWHRFYGLGRVAYLMPGHARAAFEEEAYRKLIANTARWLTAGKEEEAQ